MNAPQPRPARLARSVVAGMAFAAVTGLVHAQAASAASAAAPATDAPLWNLAYHDCADQALTRRVPDLALAPHPDHQVARALRDCADRLPAPGAGATAATLDAVTAFVQSELMQRFHGGPTRLAAAPRPTLSVGHGVTCPRPAYPRAAERAQVTGKTSLELRVDADGHVLGGDVIGSSGRSDAHRMLDGAALAAFAQCTFPSHPGTDALRMQIAFDWRLE